MDPLPKVAIVGRPNVGKSALFNRIVGKRIAIVDQQSGITRDRLGGTARWLGTHFTVIDTGGIVVNSHEPLVEQIHFQAEVAMEEADVILFLLDIAAGITALDLEVAEVIRKTDKPVLTVVNKCDSGVDDGRAPEFYALGFGDVFPVSALHGLGIGEMLDAVTSKLPEVPREMEADTALRIAVIGKPNVGKSTFINYLLQDNRLVVDDAPGTTRDAVDVRYVDEKGNAYVLVDTAGIKRSRRVKEAVEKYAFLRSQSAIEKCHAAIVVLDAMAGVTTGDARIAHMVSEAGKSAVVAVNKWDIVEEYTQKDYALYIHEQLPMLNSCPVTFTVATEGKNVRRSLVSAAKTFEEAGKEIPTGRLNRIIQNAVRKHQPPSVGKRRLNVYYATQVGVHPPHVLLFVNDRSLAKPSYLNYLVNSIRREFPFKGTPLRISLRRRK